MSVSVFYPLGGGSPINNDEIRYSLRSIEKHLKNYGEIFIIGRKPEWLQNVHFIEYEDLTPYKEKNIFTKTLMACEIKEMSEDFLFFNDDHFLVDDFDAPTFPYFYKCELQRTIQRLNGGKYKRALTNTFAELYARGKPLLNFDTHTPIVYNKEKMKSLATMYPWERYDVGFVLKSLYANTFDCLPIHEYDVKIDQANMEMGKILDIIQGKKVFSIGNNILQPSSDAILKTLNHLYPNKSKYEK